MTESNTRGLERDPTDSSTAPGSISDAVPTDSHATDLTQFQLNTLTILAEEERYGLAIKRALEEYYSQEVNQSRLYPNLDELVEKGLVEKSELDKRTNQYALTDAGRDLLQARIQWLTNHAAHAVDERHQAAPKDGNGDPVGIGSGD